MTEHLAAHRRSAVCSGCHNVRSFKDIRYTLEGADGRTIDVVCDACLSSVEVYKRLPRYLRHAIDLSSTREALELADQDPAWHAELTREGILAAECFPAAWSIQAASEDD